MGTLLNALVGALRLRSRTSVLTYSVIRDFFTCKVALVKKKRKKKEEPSKSIGSKDDECGSWNVRRVLVEGIGIADELARGMDEEPAEDRCSGTRHGRVLDRWGSVDEHRIRALKDGEGFFFFN